VPATSAVTSSLAVVPPPEGSRPLDQVKMLAPSIEDAEKIDYKNLDQAIHIRCKSNKLIRNDKEIMTEVLRRLE
jgi:hypothetical protein